MSSASSSAPLAPPPSASTAGRDRHAWLYEPGRGLRVAIGEKSLIFARTYCNLLERLVYSQYPRAVPQGDADTYYTAQLLLYGLPLGTSVEEAIETFKAAFERLPDGAALIPTDAVGKLEQALKLVHSENERLSREAHRDTVAEIQRELDKIEAAKRRGLRSNLEALHPVRLKMRKQTRCHFAAGKMQAIPTGPRSSNNQNESVALNEPNTPAILEKRKGDLRDHVDGACAKKSRPDEQNDQEELEEISERPGKDLRPEFFGSWVLRSASQERIAGLNHSWLDIVIQYDHKLCVPTPWSSVIRGYIGRIAWGGLSAYLVADDAAASSEMIGDSLKVVFNWYAEQGSTEWPAEGTLDIFFNGSSIDGYVYTGSDTKPLSFEGIKLAGQLGRLEMQAGVRELWEGISAAQRAAQSVREKRSIQVAESEKGDDGNE